ncbi:hypothetical protein BpHYR1_033082 [Brachionus plicatilis]|uniref:Uncharacterized protein n=1 Tax=Brachionus plicatilis TaxID=10195 RepID=A0A3M7RI87_BRAPC|nr:hypothetical protein BpHYR1_033082 [Brachionus plicatilis]
MILLTCFIIIDSKSLNVHILILKNSNKIYKETTIQFIEVRVDLKLNIQKKVIKIQNKKRVAFLVVFKIYCKIESERIIVSINVNLQDYLNDFLMVCILQKIAEFLQSLAYCTNLYNIVRFAEPFLHNQKKNYKAFTFCTYSQLPKIDLEETFNEIISVGIRTSGHLTGQNFQKP